ncbi:dephospho-CoA kinase [Pseudothermotoga sp.]|uniref:dephospho-CoA kinase n=1 Tax=Pseudothermotoga sp. TaxID=2033661 RepID=UPI000AF4C148
MVGLTGKMGCGKSTVAEILKELGAQVIDVDKIGHEVLKEETVKDRLRQLFGPEIFCQGEVDRKKLAKAVFEDEEKLRILESVVHPVIKDRVLKMIEGCSNVVVLDAALLRRIGLAELCDVIITVKCDEAKIVERLEKKGLSQEEIQRRLAAQKDIVEEGIVIENNFDLASLRNRVLDIYKRLLEGGVGG